MLFPLAPQLKKTHNHATPEDGHGMRCQACEARAKLRTPCPNVGEMANDFPHPAHLYWSVR
jgi:hypothetical protein